jgi:hypothetical protein
VLAVAVVAVAFQGAPEFSGPRVLFPEAPLIREAPTSSAVASDQPGRQDALDVVRVDLSWVLWVALALAVIVGLALLWRRLRRALDRPELRPLPPLIDGGGMELDAETPEREPEPAVVRRGLERALETLGEQREPRDAIERAWVGLEEGAADSGVRRLPAETPSEFASRVVARVAADREAADTLLRLYLRVRFSEAPVTAADVATARAAIERLRASWSDAARGSRR